MPSPFRIVSREEIGFDPIVRSSSGSPRPRIHLPAAYITHHYTGVNVRYADIGDTIAEIRAIEAWAASVGKPNEYNYVNHQDPDDLLFEYAKEYRAAHSGGENSISLGILHLNGIKEPLTQLQIAKTQWLNDVFRYFRMRDAGTLDRGHRDMPGASTACPGDDIYSKVKYMALSPHTPPSAPPPKPEPKPPVPVDPPDSSQSGFYLVTDGKSPWAISSEVYGTGTKWPEIMEANAPDETPNPGERWAAPGFAGIWTTVKQGEGPLAILNRLFGSDGWNRDTGVEQFWQWNGGDPSHGGRRFNGKLIHIQPGERVWVRN